MEYNSNNEVLNEKIRQWLEWDRNETTSNEIKSLCESEQWEVLDKRLCTRLAFGTAGLRGPMQAGFNSMNDLVVVQTAQGLCKYILKCFPDETDRKRGIVLGYDGRYNSKRFAELSACVFINAGIPVWLYSRMVPTPFVPFGILLKKTLAGVMVTASHNPKEDNGYKVYWENGAQIISPHDKMIQSMILDNLCPAESSWDCCSLQSPLLKDPYAEVYKIYYEKLLDNIPQKFLECNDRSKDLRFVYSAMHGVGYPFVKRAFEIGRLQPAIPVAEQQEADPEFPTVKFPNPEEGKSALELSIKLANEKGVTVILANDPDADRLALAEKNEETGEWKVFSGNEIGALLGWWAVQCYKEKNPGDSLSDCYLLASTVSSKILAAVAKIEGLHFEETLTGFKWMGNKTVDLQKAGKKVLFAFEEAIGFMFSPTVLDKDGVSAACHLATMRCYVRQHENISLTQKLNKIYETYGYHSTIVSYYLCYDPELIKRIFERIRYINGDKEESYPTSVLDGKYKISSIRDLTTGVDTAVPDRKAKLPSSSSTQMITFRFENGVVVTLRTSGTEPKVKYYAEMCAQPEEKNWTNLREILAEVVDAVVEEFLQPKINNLIPRSD